MDLTLRTLRVGSAELVKILDISRKLKDLRLRTLRMTHQTAMLVSLRLTMKLN